MMCDPPPISSAPRTEEGSSIFRRTCSLTVESTAHSLAASPSRATFPFKPASTLIALQKSRFMSMDNDPIQHNARIENSVSHDACHLPATFRPRPVVPALQLQTPRRCASFPADLHSESQMLCPPPEPPEWLVSRERSIRPFPISPHLAKDKGCWWLRDMAKILKRKSSSTLVQVGEDEIELVESEEDIIDGIEIIEEVQDDSSNASNVGDSKIPVSEAAQSKDEQENTEAVDASTTVPSLSSSTNSDDATVLQGNLKDLRVEMEQANYLNPEKRLRVEKFLHEIEGSIQMDEKTAEATDVEISVDAAEVEKIEGQSNDSTPSAIDHIRRTAVGITGGALTAAGVVLIPCPVIPGCVVVYAGLMILATEFDGAKNALHSVKEPLEKWLADEEVEDANASEDEKDNALLWEELIGCAPAGSRRASDIDDEFTTMMNRKTDDVSGKNGQKSTNNAGKAKNNPLKPFLRKLLQLDPPVNETAKNKVETRNASVKNENPEDDNTSSKNGQSETSADPPSPCHGELSGCQFMSFDFEDDDNQSTCDDAKEKAHLRQNSIRLRRLCSDESITLNTLNNDLDETLGLFSRQNTANEDRLFSDESITLNTMYDPDDSIRSREDTIRLLSRQNTPADISYANDNGCMWVISNGIIDLLEDGCSPDNLAIDKKKSDEK